MSLNIGNLIKASGKESANFAKKNAMKFAIVGDLQTARDGCKTKEAKALVNTLIGPLQKELQKEAAAYDKRMSGIWKQAKGEEIPKDAQKELDNALKKSADAIKSKSGKDVKPNSDPGHSKWIDIMSNSWGT
ncbi:hypothetical protein [uncultured Tateyamaria sp.]|uniref:hypothetical protein n=1 Tax=uncultured Tateyamaria sp. TaxID=455651 RepID=UPI0026110936|nr:hypothetical protein [uncultured Tateyamaria sp.]